MKPSEPRLGAWPQDKIDVFQRWTESGFQPSCRGDNTVQFLVNGSAAYLETNPANCLSPIKLLTIQSG